MVVSHKVHRDDVAAFLLEQLQPHDQRASELGVTAGAREVAAGAKGALPLDETVAAAELSDMAVSSSESSVDMMLS